MPTPQSPVAKNPWLQEEQELDDIYWRINLQKNGDFHSAIYNVVEEALLYAVELLQRMDDTLNYGIVPLSPDVLVWMIDKYEPNLIANLRHNGHLEEFLMRLGQYKLLRAAAISHQRDEHCLAEEEMCHDLQDFGHVELEHLAQVLRTDDWKPDDDSATAVFNKVIFTAISREKISRERLYEVSVDVAKSIGTRTDTTERNYLLDSESSGLTGAENQHSESTQLSNALRYAKDILHRLDSGQHSQFWCNVYTSIFGEWLAFDYPELAKSILLSEEYENFYDHLSGYTRRMQTAEHILNKLSFHLEKLIITCVDTELEAVRLIEQAILAHGDAVDKNDIPSLARDVLAMIKRRAYPHGSPRHKIMQTDESSVSIDTIRHDSINSTTCYILDSNDLPYAFQGKTDEPQCLAVRLPEERLVLSDELADSFGLKNFWSTFTNGDFHSELSINKAFWCEKKVLWPSIFRFRTSIPVLYVLNETSIFVNYRFNHFVNINEIKGLTRHTIDSVHINDGEWTYRAEFLTSKLPDGTQVKPTLLRRVVDLSGFQRDTSLGDAYVKLRPEVLQSD